MTDIEQWIENQKKIENTAFMVSKVNYEHSKESFRFKISFLKDDKVVRVDLANGIIGDKVEIPLIFLELTETEQFKFLKKYGRLVFRQGGTSNEIHFKNLVFAILE